MIRTKFILVTLCTVIFVGVSGGGFGLNKKPGQQKEGYEDYLPFRSAEAKEQFLKVYDQRGKNWPVPSTHMTDITF